MTVKNNPVITTRNLKRCIKLDQQSSYAGGAFSTYFKYNSTQGIKVLYSQGHRSIKALRRSNVWRSATKEHSLLKKCKHLYHKIPKTYGVWPIKIAGIYYPGIVMEHIHGIMLETHGLNKKLNWDGVNAIIKSIDKTLKKYDIYHGDLHSQNIMINAYTNDYYILDFDPQFVGIGEYPDDNN
jgi:RIO-like serine/threonine protein kinase